MTAKEYLSERSWEISKMREALDEDKERLMRIEARLTSASQALDGMPHGSAHGGLEMAIGRKDELKKSIAISEIELADAEFELWEAVRMVHDPELCRVLELRYVDRLDWDTVADRAHHSRRNIFRLHGRALASFEKLALNGTL